jgi:hypothetical protein
MGCDFQQIYVLTDIEPVSQICQEILDDFQLEVEKILLNITQLTPAAIQKILIKAKHRISRPIRWLKEITKHLPMKVDYRTLLEQIIPVIRNSSIVEFASLFTKFAIIEDSSHYQTALRTVFSKHISNLFFYYTGHGIKIYPNWDTSKHEACLVIPNSTYDGATVGFCTKQELQHCFEPILNKTNAFIVFDCCHGERMIDLPFNYTLENLPLHQQKTTQPEIIYLSSTQNDQTCGFYTSKREYGSVYTYYLLKFLNRVADQLSSLDDHSSFCQLEQLYHQVEEKVNKYRMNSGKPPQNMYVSLSHSQINELPIWLFSQLYSQMHRSRDQLNLIEISG